METSVVTTQSSGLFFVHKWNNLWNIVIYKDGQVTVYEETDVAHFFEEKDNHSILMSINTNGAFINCHFFSEDEIEFDIDPKEVKSKSEANAVFEFMKNLSKILDKDISYWRKLT